MIAIVHYNAGNIRSVQNALQRIGAAHVVTEDPAKLAQAAGVIFPGVGEASSAMQYLKARSLDQVLVSLKQPVLGICLGMQLMCRSSEEGPSGCLGIFDTEVKRFPPQGRTPHMGWNSLDALKGPLFEGIEAGSDMYFVHSYYAGLCSQTIAQCGYLLPFSAALQRDNFYGVQFHAEKSAGAGERLLQNFLNLCV